MMNRFKQIRWKDWLLVVGFILIYAYPRTSDLGTYATADEPLYLKSSASFYYLLNEGRFEETDLIIHPGVVNLWAGAAAYHLQFPDYAGHANTEYPISDLHFRNIVERSGEKQMVLLATGRGITVIIQALLLGAALFFGIRVMGRWPAVIGFLLISFDPFNFANSRILQPDGILAASLLLSVIAYLDYLRANKPASLVFSGIGAGLCWLSKLVGLVLGPMLLGIAVFAWWQSWRGDKKKALLLIRDLFIWLLVALVIFVALWPVMWVEPLSTLGAYLRQSFLMSQDVNSPMFFNGALNPEGEFGLEYFYYYLLVMFNLTTPLILLGLVLGAASLFWRREASTDAPDSNHSAPGLLLALVVFLVVMTLSSKKADRYVVSAFMLLDLLAGVGYWLALSKLRRMVPAAKGYLPAALVVVVVGLQAFLVWQAAPYYHSYYNPLWGSAQNYQDRFQVGWGEGLNEAAHYLNSQEDMNTKVVYSWYSATFDLFYEFRSQEIFIAPSLLDAQFENILDADYAVIYISQWQRQPDTLLIQFLSDKTPEYTVQINGFDYVSIYNMREIAAQSGD